MKIVQSLSLNTQLKYASDLSAFLKPSISWHDIEWIKSNTKLPIFLKGILGSEDARIAKSLGVNGIIISNHGGRQLDTCVSAIDSLPRILDVVGDNLDILIDGGIRRGTDILKAIALGAKGVMVGRPGERLDPGAKLPTLVAKFRRCLLISLSPGYGN